MAQTSAIPLAEAIRDLRSELLEALSEGADKELHFRLKPIELELNLSVSREAGGEGKVKFWVVELGANGKLKQDTAHKLKLVLDPRGRDGGEFDVSALSERRSK